MIFNTAQQALLYPCFLNSIYLIDDPEQKKAALRNAYAIRDLQLVINTQALPQQTSENFIMVTMTTDGHTVNLRVTGFTTVTCTLQPSSDNQFVYTCSDTNKMFSGTRLFLYVGASLTQCSTPVQMCISCVSLSQQTPKLSIQTLKGPTLDPPAASAVQQEPEILRLTELAFMSQGYNTSLTRSPDGLTLSLLPGIGKGSKRPTVSDYELTQTTFTPQQLSQEIRSRTTPSPGLKSINGIYDTVTIAGGSSVDVHVNTQPDSDGQSQFLLNIALAEEKT